MLHVLYLMLFGCGFTSTSYTQYLMMGRSVLSFIAVDLPADLPDLKQSSHNSEIRSVYVLFAIFLLFRLSWSLWAS